MRIQIFLNPVVLIGLTMIAVVGTGCSKNGKSGSSAVSTTETWAYTVNVPAMPSDSVNVEIALNCPSNDSVKLVLPPAYADNPLLLADSVGGISHLSITDRSGRSVPYLTGSIVMGHQLSTRLIFSAAGSDSLNISYTVKLGYKVAQASGSDLLMPHPHISSTQGYLSGPYLFAWPCPTGSVPNDWREPRDISLNWMLPPGVFLYGDTEATEHCSNVYELLFHQTALASSSSRIIASGISGGQSYRIVSISDTTTFDASTIADANRIASAIFAYIAPKFDTTNRTFTIITGINNGIGLEGMNALCIMDPTSANSAQFSANLAHEIIHSWVGVRVGSLDIPWWKEGTTMYLGVYTAVNLGLRPSTNLKTDLTSYFDSTVATALTRSLDDPSILEDEYYGPNGTGNLIYRKGGQVCLLLDAAIREHTANKSTFIDEVAAFCRLHMDGTFTHDEYTTFLRSAGGDEVDSIFARWETTKGFIPDSVISRADSIVLAGISTTGGTVP